MPSSLVILNPYTGRWAGRRRRPEAERALRAAGVDFELVETQGPRHGEQLAEEATRQGRPIIVAGGDGSIGEAINGMYRARPEGALGPIGVLPVGTANDLVHNLGLPLQLDQAAKLIAGGRTRRIDLIQANDWVFCNNSAVGLEPVVTRKNIELVRWRGMVRYLLAALLAIADKPTWRMHLAWDDGEYDGPVSLVSVGNCAITGGLFRMAPAADPTDGLITFVYGYAPTRRRMLSLLPRAMSGAYVRDPAMHQIHSRRLTIEARPATPIQVDGELRSESLTHVTYQILPARLDIYAA
ncbi:MAG TPA: diacylglycerol kinase family protein [Anaerolineales bacterium]|nr:diacylglycerol kinase family protein [Anaerolineales bacterium]